MKIKLLNDYHTLPQWAEINSEEFVVYLTIFEYIFPQHEQLTPKEGTDGGRNIKRIKLICRGLYLDRSHLRPYLGEKEKGVLENILSFLFPVTALLIILPNPIN